MNTIVIDKIIKREAGLRNMPINQIAIECHIPTSVLHSWVNGTLPSAKNLHHIQKLSVFLGISVEELLFGTQDKDLERRILFSTTFVDAGSKYRFTVEKIT